MAKRNYNRKKNAIYRKTVENMKTVGTYLNEFDTTIERYAELRVQFENLNTLFVEDGCKVTEEYTNKSGATNVRKTAQYLALETLRKELVELENIFGLTPKGLKGIQSKSLEGKKASALEEALIRLGG